MTLIELAINNAISCCIDAIIPARFVFILIVIVAGFTLLQPKIGCFLGFHSYRTLKATNLGDGKIWEIHEKCNRCPHEQTVVRSKIGRF